MSNSGKNFKLYFQEILHFLTTRKFWTNFGGILLYFIALSFLASWLLKCYTKHGESLQVDDFTGMNLEDAIDKANGKSFSVKVIDSVFVVGKRPHVVISQNPVAMSRVKENRTIYLTITKASADMVTLPNITDGNDDLSQFEKRLALMGINTKVIQRVFDDRLAENTIIDVRFDNEIISEKLGSGFKVPRGSTVELIVSEKGGTSVDIPNLVCKKYDAARFVITNFNLSVGSVVKDNTVTDELSAYVWKQSPEYKPGAKMRVGEQLSVYLTQEKPASCSNESEGIEEIEDQ